MKKIKSLVLGVLLTILVPLALWAAGTWDSSGTFYRPSFKELFESPTGHNLFTEGLTRAGNRVGKEIWVGDPNYGTTFQDAVTAIGSNNVTLRLAAGVYPIPENLTIPANIALDMLKGADLQVANGKTLTIQGDYQCGLYKTITLTGTGKVVFGGNAVKEVWAEWWGAIGDDSADDTAAIQAAVTAASGVAPLKLLAKTYKCASSLSIPANISIHGVLAVDGKSALHYTGNSDFITWVAPASPGGSNATKYRATWRDINIIGNATAGKLVTFADGTESRLWKNVRLDYGTIGLYGKSTTYTIDKNTFINCHWEANLVQAIKLELDADDATHGYVEMFTFMGCTFRSSGTPTVELIGDGILPKNITSFTFIECDASFTTGTMYSLTRTSSIRFIGGEISNNTIGINIVDAGSEFIYVVGVSEIGNGTFISDTNNKLGAVLGEEYSKIGGTLKDGLHLRDISHSVMKTESVVTGDSSYQFWRNNIQKWNIFNWGAAGTSQDWLHFYNAPGALHNLILKDGGKVNLPNLPVYANNAAALAGGLVANDLYRTGDGPDSIRIVHVAGDSYNYAPDSAHYLTTQSEGPLSAEFSLGGLTSGLLKHTVAAGVSTPATAVEGTDYQPPPAITNVASSSWPRPAVGTAGAEIRYHLTALAEAATFGAPTGTPVNGQKLLIRILDNGTARALAWNAAYRAGDIALPATTTPGKTMYCSFAWNAADSKWDFLGTVGGL